MKIKDIQNEGLKKIFAGGQAKAAGDREPDTLGEGDRGRQMIVDMREALALCVDDAETIQGVIEDALCHVACFLSEEDYEAAVAEADCNELEMQSQMGVR